MEFTERRTSFQVNEGNKNFANQVLSHYSDFFEKNEEAIERSKASNPNKEQQKNIKIAEQKLSHLKNTIVGIESSNAFKKITDKSINNFRERTVEFLSSIQNADGSRNEITVGDLGKNLFELGKYVAPVAATAGATALATLATTSIPLLSAAIAGAGSFATKRVNDIFEDKIKHYFNEVKNDVKALFDKESYQDKNLLTSLSKFEESKSVNVLDNLYHKLKDENARIEDVKYSMKQMNAEVRTNLKNINNVDLDLHFKQNNTQPHQSSWREREEEQKIRNNLKPPIAR